MYNSGNLSPETLKPNRAQRRKDAGINKRGLHKIKEGRVKIIIDGTLKWKHFIQKIPLKNSFGKIIGYRKVTHTTTLKTPKKTTNKN